MCQVLHNIKVNQNLYIFLHYIIKFDYIITKRQYVLHNYFNEFTENIFHSVVENVENFVNNCK
jgi:hypothetical protein